jgi:hypothetical protein
MRTDALDDLDRAINAGYGLQLGRKPGGQSRTNEDKQDRKPVPCFTPAAWATREIPLEDYLLGEMLSTSIRVLFAADTGLGKTMFSLSLSADSDPIRPGFPR